MYKGIAWFSLTLVIIILWACASKTTSEIPEAKKSMEVVDTSIAKVGWEAEWENVRKEARKERKVVLYTAAFPELRTVIIETMNEYGITADFVSGRGTELAAKIVSERKAGIYTVDIIISGLSPMVSLMKPAGIFQPLEPVLILPEVKDTKLWLEGKLHFTNEDRLILAFNAWVDYGIHINTDIVKPDDINSAQDLLSPRWKGKIIIDDPTTSGRGQNWLAVAAIKLGDEYIKQLVKQEPLLTRDLRLQVDWIAKGRYPIGIGVRAEPYQEYKKAGSPITHLIIKEVSFIEGGIGYTGYVDRAPHPNASRVFLNWFLSKKGQSIWQEIRREQSARIDLPVDYIAKAGFPVRRQGVDYFDVRTDTWELETAEKIKTRIREAFLPLVR